MRIEMQSPMCGRIHPILRKKTHQRDAPHQRKKNTLTKITSVHHQQVKIRVTSQPLLRYQRRTSYPDLLRSKQSACCAVPTLKIKKLIRATAHTRLPECASRHGRAALLRLILRQSPYVFVQLEILYIVLSNENSRFMVGMPAKWVEGSFFVRHGTLR